jgi:hypothetical protein
MPTVTYPVMRNEAKNPKQQEGRLTAAFPVVPFSKMIVVPVPGTRVWQRSILPYIILNYKFIKYFK